MGVATLCNHDNRWISTLASWQVSVCSYSLLWRQPSGQSIEGSLRRAGRGTRPDQRDFPGQIGTVGNYSLVYTRVLTRIQPGFASSVNAPNLDCNPGWLNPHPLADWNSVRDRKWVESGLELSCKQGLCCCQVEGEIRVDWLALAGQASPSS